MSGQEAAQDVGFLYIIFRWNRIRGRDEYMEIPFLSFHVLPIPATAACS